MNLGNVLIVDDDALSRFITGTVLDLSGAAGKVSYAEHGREALELMDREPFDLVLLDLNMPVLDGWEVLEAVQGSASLALPSIVILTSSLSAFDRQKAAQYPAVSGFLTKPFSDGSVDDLLGLRGLAACSAERQNPATRRAEARGLQA